LTFKKLHEIGSERYTAPKLPTEFQDKIKVYVHSKCVAIPYVFVDSEENLKLSKLLFNFV